VPTLAEYLPKVIAAEGPGAQRTYSTYWDHILTAFGDRHLDQITATDIETLMRQVMATTIHRRNHQHGRYAGEHLIAAIRAIYTHAVADELIPPHRNPAAKVRKPRRPPSSRRALSAAELVAITSIAA
jgi:integrase